MTHKQALVAAGAFICLLAAFAVWVLSEARGKGEDGAAAQVVPIRGLAETALSRADGAKAAADDARMYARAAQEQSLEAQKDVRALSSQIQTGRRPARLQGEPVMVEAGGR